MANKHILVVVSHGRMILLPFKTHVAAAEVLKLELVGGPQLAIS